MQQLTQKQEDNCLQTCVAMLLDRDPEELPDQHAIGVDYVPSLRTYLRKHFGTTYVEVGPERFEEVARQRVFHLMIGETVRTSPSHDVWHATVGHAGEIYWDVHPTRVGLTKVFKWGFIAPLPYAWRVEMDRQAKIDPRSAVCVCSICIGKTQTASTEMTYVSA